MKISLKWLNDYIDVKEFFAKPQELAAKLTAGGLEVESIQNLAKQFEQVVIGHILEKGQHPNADRLSLCQVATGEGRVHQIVCGAQNHKQHDLVVVALPGAVLPGDFAIKHSKIRGVESGGMLCSLKELGLAKESEGIMILPPDAPIGRPFAEYMGMNDIVFELKVTPNRADCLSHWGLAREIACLLGRECKFPMESLSESAVSTKAAVSLDVRATDLCGRYAGRLMKNVKVGPSPEWLKQRLEVVGMNSINNIVDVTNFVMLELGQPLHAFDLRELKGSAVVVDRARSGEKFVTLDGTEIELQGDELMIRDSDRSVALAGVVGGKNSGIQDDTTDIFIESAYFISGGVRKTARKFGIETDSAYRFSRGVNPDAIVLAMNRAAQLIQKIAGGEICGDAHDFYPHPVVRAPIVIGLATLEESLGYTVDAKEFESWMTRLGCRIEGSSEAWKVTPPSYRWDISIDMDLVEEFARLHGYEHIPERLPSWNQAPSDDVSSYSFEKKLRKHFQAAGYHQAINYAFISDKYQNQILGSTEKLNKFGLKTSAKGVQILNPLNEDLNVMRLSLLPGLIKNVVHSLRHGSKVGRLFEVGFSHAKAESGEGYAQEWRVGFAHWGAAEGLWQKQGSATSVFFLKTNIEKVLRNVGVSKFRWVKLVEPKEAPDFIHPGQCIALEVEGKQVGFIGTLHPSLQEELKIRENTALGEICLDKILGSQTSPRFKAISNFPSMERDLALVMPKELSASEVESVIRRAAGELLISLKVFDVFEGASLPAGQKSVAFRLIFQDLQGTLDDTKVNELRDQVLVAVGQKFSIGVR